MLPAFGPTLAASARSGEHSRLRKVALLFPGRTGYTRVMADRPKSSMPLWIAAGILLLPVLYLSSFAPLMALGTPDVLPEPLRAGLEVYAVPIRLSYNHGPEWWKHFLKRYEEICSR